MIDTEMNKQLAIVIETPTIVVLAIEQLKKRCEQAELNRDAARGAAQRAAKLAEATNAELGRQVALSQELSRTHDEIVKLTEREHAAELEAKRSLLDKALGCPRDVPPEVEAGNWGHLIGLVERLSKERDEARKRLRAHLPHLADYDLFTRCYMGGHSEGPTLDAFQQGMHTVCSLARAMLTNLDSASDSAGTSQAQAAHEDTDHILQTSEAPNGERGEPATAPACERTTGSNAGHPEADPRAHDGENAVRNGVAAAPGVNETKALSDSTWEPTTRTDTELWQCAQGATARANAQGKSPWRCEKAAKRALYDLGRMDERRATRRVEALGGKP